MTGTIEGMTEEIEGESPDGDYSAQVTVGGDRGLHVRVGVPLVTYLNASCPYEAHIEYGGETLNAKDILDVLTSGAPSGSSIRFKLSPVNGGAVDSSMADEITDAVQGILNGDPELLARWKE